MASERRFGSWTGKTPLTILNEHCAKNGWKNTISTTRKKTWNSEISIVQGSKTLKYSHSLAVETADAQDARHFAATFALFQIAGHLSLRNVLPPDHSAYWKELQSHAANSSEISCAKESRIPEKSSTSLISSHSNNSISVKSNGRGKVQLPSIFLDQEIRSEIEALIRDTGVYKVQDVKLDSTSQKSLLRAGFRKVHVEEAADYVGNVQDAIHWLCIHVPEDGN